MGKKQKSSGKHKERAESERNETQSEAKSVEKREETRKSGEEEKSKKKKKGLRAESEASNQGASLVGRESRLRGGGGVQGNSRVWD